MQSRISNDYVINLCSTAIDLIILTHQTGVSIEDPFNKIKNYKTKLNFVCMEPKEIRPTPIIQILF